MSIINNSELIKLIAIEFQLDKSKIDNFIKRFASKLINTILQTGVVSLEGIGTFNITITKPRKLVLNGEIKCIKPYKKINYSNIKPLNSSISLIPIQKYIIELIKDPQYDYIRLSNFGKFINDGTNISFKPSYILKSKIKG